MIEARYALLGDHIEMLPRSVVFFYLGHFLHNVEDDSRPPEGEREIETALLNDGGLSS